MAMKRLELGYMLALFAMLLAVLQTHATAQTVSEGPDYASVELRNAWDMSGEDDIYPLLWTHNLAHAESIDGVLVATARDNDPHFWLKFPTIPSSMTPHNAVVKHIDANLYTHLNFLMWLPESIEPGARVGRLIWHKGGQTVAEFDAAYSESPLFPVYPGWHLYQFDLSSIVPLSGSVWRDEIHGLRIDPCLGCNVQFKIDWARLHNHQQAASTIEIPSGKNLVLAKVTPPGAVSSLTFRLPSMDGKISVASLPPGIYPTASVTDGDYALSQRGRPWALDERGDLIWSLNHGISGAQIGSEGFSGITRNSDPSIQLDVPANAPINAEKYRYLSIDLTLQQIPSQESGLLVWWGNRYAEVVFPSNFIPTRPGRVTYELDLSQYPSWIGQIKSIRIDPLNGPNAGSGINFTLHGVRLTKSKGLRESAEFNQSLSVNARPIVDIISPGLEDGEDYAIVEQGRPWKMLQDQVRAPQLSNLTAWTYTSTVPDLGLSGSFFQGVSQPARMGQTEGDPHVFLAFQENANPINANNYRWLGFDLYVPMDATRQDELTRGAMARIAWKIDDYDAGVTSDDIILMPGMRRYWFDMQKIAYEPASSRNWSGLVRYLRIDPFEFPESRIFFAGTSQLRTTPAARYVLPVKFNIQDAEDDAFSVQIKSGTIILASASALRRGPHEIFANLSNLPPGEHILTIDVNDGKNTTSTNANIPFIKLQATDPLPTPQIKAADRIFNWAESLLPDTLGAGTPSTNNHTCLQFVPGAYGRFYANSHICLFTIDGLIAYTTNDENLSVVGSTQTLLDLAYAAGH